MGNEQLLSIGARIDHFEIREVLGVGGFGVTYKAWDHQLERWLALKEFLPIDFALREHNSQTVRARPGRHDDYSFALARFLDEARTLAKFRHPNIVRVSQFLERNGTAYLVMDYERGLSLSQWLKAHSGQIDESQLRAWFLPILRGLAEVHRAGILHRDIKPGNIYLREDGDPLLIDFGAARQAIGEQTRSITGIVSTGYAPIEQYGSDAKKQGPWTDLYAIGATMYRCISGRDPLDAPTRQSALFEGEAEPMPSAQNIGVERYSNAILELIDALLVLPIRDRPQSATEVLTWLETGQRPAVEPPAAIATALVGADQDNRTVIAPTSRQSRRGKSSGPEPMVSPQSIRRVAPSQTSASSTRRGRTPALIVSTLVLLVGSATAFWYFTDETQPTAATPNPETKLAAVPGERVSSSEPVDSANSIADPSSLLGGQSIVRIDSEPLGAEVRLNGLLLGTTPFESAEIQQGEYLLTASASGFDDHEETVVLEDNRVYSQRIMMVAASGELTVLSEPSGARIYVDGEDTGERTPATLTGLAVGAHRIQLRADEFETFENEISVSAEQVSRVNATLSALRYGTLEVAAKPANASIRVLELEEPYKPGMRLPIGDYRLQISAAGHQDAEQAISIREDALTQATVELKAVMVPLAVKVEPLESVPFEIVELGRVYPPGTIQVPAGRYTLRAGGDTYDGLKFATTEVRVDARSPSGASATLKLLRDVDSGRVFRDTLLDGSEGPELVVLPLGSYAMGSAGESAESPVQTVLLEQPVAMMKYEVSFADYERYTRATRGRLPSDEGWGRDNRPVINVNWQDAQGYAAWLSAQTSQRYRLPSEAEWEFAARAGSANAYSTGDRISCEQAHFDQMSGECGNMRSTVPVGSFAANPYGLHDLHGNVWEWVEDCWFENLRGIPSDGSARSRDGGCDRRTRRGGSWFNSASSLRASARSALESSIRDKINGFRLVREMD